MTLNLKHGNKRDPFKFCMKIYFKKARLVEPAKLFLVWNISSRDIRFILFLDFCFIKKNFYDTLSNRILIEYLSE
jgi:hypothetical protein